MKRIAIFVMVAGLMSMFGFGQGKIDNDEKQSREFVNEQEVEKAFRDWVNSKIVFPPVAAENVISGSITEDKSQDAETAFRNWINSRLNTKK